MHSTSTWEAVIQQIETMNMSEQLSLIRYLVDKIQAKNMAYHQPSKLLVSMIGSGQGCYNSPEEAEQFLRKEREQWN